MVHQYASPAYDWNVSTSQIVPSTFSHILCSFWFVSLWKNAIRAIGKPIKVNLGRMFGCRTKRRSMCLLNHGLTWATGLIKLSGWRSSHGSELWKTRLSPRVDETFFECGVTDKIWNFSWEFVTKISLLF